MNINKDIEELNKLWYLLDDVYSVGLVEDEERNKYQEAIYNVVNYIKTRNFGRDKAVNQYDKNYNFIKSYNSLTEASRETKIFEPAICNVCKNKRKTAGGYIWRYADE